MCAIYFLTSMVIKKKNKKKDWGILIAQGLLFLPIPILGPNPQTPHYKFFCRQKKDVFSELRSPKKITIFFLFPRKFPPIVTDGPETYTTWNRYWIPHLPLKFEVRPMVTSFFFSILCQKVDHFSDFPIFWHFDAPKFWVLEVRVQIQVNRIQVGPKLYATIFP